MLRYTRRFLFHIPRTPLGAAEPRRVAQGAPSSARFRRSGDGLRNGMQDNAAEPPAAHTEGATSPRRLAGYQHRRRQVSRTLRPGEPLPPPHEDSKAQTSKPAQTGSGGYTSQRQAYHRQRAERGRDDAGSFARADVAGSYFTPLPREYGFYDGLDEHTLDAPRPSREERQEQLRASLEANAASAVEFTEGGEADIEMNGLPAEHYHGQAGWTTIPKESALYNTMYGTGDLESRQRTSSWGVAMRHGRGGAGLGDLLGESAAAPNAQSETGDGATGETDTAAEVLDDRRRRRQHDEGFYSTALEGELLAPTEESVGQPRSTYALRKMYVDGLVGYQGMISRAEEAVVSEELLRLLQSSRAAYIAEEARYCVNLYEKELGIPGKDTLAFALSSCPTLQRVLYRLFFLGLIPAVPNVCQVSEMVGNFSGYPVHRHPRSIGSYVGLLNLVSTTVLRLQHKDAPWYPRLHLTPRSLFVVTEPCLSEYAMGYKQTQQPFHAFEYATRVSSDYRIEVLFATVETAQMRTLSEAVQLTEYATSSTNQDKGRGDRGAVLLGGSSSSSDSGSAASSTGVAEDSHNAEMSSSVPLQGNTDEWLQQLRSKLHSSGEGEGHEKPIDGHALRRQLLAQHIVGSQSRGEGKDARENRTDSRQRRTTGNDPLMPPSSSPEVKAHSSAQRRLTALKARFEFAQSLKASKRQVEVSKSGPRLLRGHSPKDRHIGIK
ncbi:hypothetical protein ABB37_07538 [Leptomonas pyrrhocoris]|uniref:Uncharacterized protein n=1 Tax=Leptomonas pyrrhocoris TaxID=157538 RepID=A0A0N0DSX2_LEPPY|nr:hypothetical protein ABB37_07538 [Leptomonas pyrrhocoris]XP_015655131.1 hypothetical protein ABB37_07538 [Leptomonas pyrrhocoris]KPA76691.1 hypothetical protein ABB37_07538 [Leptomonas pyrrhocoris]KPA76692.1 hypothetical protein ABB37_07538 [Leptomonas pyrrhocoris]|eukprot:XP_015655130.1 hypothetical protein ABB37_07538 [Leptomonas pyrrhocoris]